MYESTQDALSNLYPRLSAGGFCVIDDYNLPGCRAAVDEFRSAQRIVEPMIEIDHGGRYWRKNSAAD
jgi:O-methyltransferase